VVFPVCRQTKPTPSPRSRHPELLVPMLHGRHDHRHGLIPTLALLPGEQHAPHAGLRTRGP